MRKALIIGSGLLLVVFAAGLWIANSKGLLLGYAQLFSYTDDASGLNDGSKVRVDGVPIGYLDHQRLTGSRDPRRRVEFDMKVQTRALSKIPVDSAVGIAADNLMGDLSINITRGESQQHVQPGAELRSVKAIDPNKLMADIGNQLQALQAVADRANALLSGVDAGQGTLGKFRTEWDQKYGTLPDDVKKLIDDYQNAHGTLDKVFVHNDELNNQIDTTKKRIDDLMAGIQPGQGTRARVEAIRREFDRTQKEIDSLNAAIKTRSGNLRDLQQRADDLTAKMDGIAARIDNGQGTLGLLLVNPQLSEALTGTTKNFQALARDMRANPRKFFAFRFALF